MILLESSKAEETCKHCGSSALVKYGFYKQKQLYMCKVCRRKIRLYDNQHTINVSSEMLAESLNMYFSGLSLRKIMYHLEISHGYRTTRSIIHQWFEKYSSLSMKNFRKYQPQVSDKWIILGTSTQVCGKNLWIFDVVDQDSHYLLSSRLVYKRNISEIQSLLEEASALSKVIPMVIKTDKSNYFAEAVELAFGSDTVCINENDLDFQPNSGSVKNYRKLFEVRNKIIGTLRRFRSADKLMDGWSINYNYFQTQKGLLNRTPAEAAGIKYDCHDWLKLIETTL